MMEKRIECACIVENKLFWFFSEGNIAKNLCSFYFAAAVFYYGTSNINFVVNFSLLLLFIQVNPKHNNYDGRNFITEMWPTETKPRQAPRKGNKPKHGGEL